MCVYIAAPMVLLRIIRMMASPLWNILGSYAEYIGIFFRHTLGSFVGYFSHCRGACAHG